MTIPNTSFFHQFGYEWILSSGSYIRLSSDFYFFHSICFSVSLCLSLYPFTLVFPPILFLYFFFSLIYSLSLFSLSPLSLLLFLLFHSYLSCIIIFLISVLFLFFLFLLIFLSFCYSTSFTHKLLYYYYFFSENQAPLSFLASNTVVLFYTSLFQPHLSAFICHSSICQRNLLSSLTTSTVVIFFYFNLSSPVRIDVDNLGTLWTELQSYSPISSNPLSPTHLLNL